MIRLDRVNIGKGRPSNYKVPLLSMDLLASCSHPLLIPLQTESASLYSVPTPIARHIRRLVMTDAIERTLSESSMTSDGIVMLGLELH